MPKQKELFESGTFEDEKTESLPYQRHSPSSREAAEQAKRTSTHCRLMVLEAIRECEKSGATDDEIQTKLGLDGSSERPRRVELVRKRLVIDSGKTRKTRTGRKATVWVAVEYS